MVDLVQAQKDFFQLLQCSARLQTVNIALQREMQLKASIDVAEVWTTPRNGCAGIGIIVEMPEAQCESNNVGGPVLDWSFTAWVLEVPQLNFAQAQPGRPARGSCIAAETVVQLILDEVHLYADEKLATWKAASAPVSKANMDGLAIGYRVKFMLPKGRTAQTQRTGQTQITLAAGSTTLACAGFPAAQIWYTTDGSFPANSKTINPQAKLYTSAVAAAAGTVLRARAYSSGLLGGSTAQATTI